jgi:hypothetical protein
MGMDGVIFRLRMAGPALAPAVVLETPLEVRAGSPLGKILGGPIEGLTDPAKLWAK